MTLSAKTFKEQFVMLSINFGISLSDEAGKSYANLIYFAIKDLTTDQLFLRNAQNLMRYTTAEDWNKKYGFGGKPAVADWIKIFEVQRQKIMCEPFLEFGTYVSHRYETIEQAIKREESLLKHNNTTWNHLN